MSLLFPLGLLQLQVVQAQHTTTTPISHFVAQQYVYHSPSVYSEHELVERHADSSVEFEGRYTSPRVFFDDDSLDESREIRLEERLREERIRQLRKPLGPPVREVRRYEKSVEGDLDYSEDKKIKLNRRRRATDFATSVVHEIKKYTEGSEGSEGIEERRRFLTGFKAFLGNNEGLSGQWKQQLSSQYTTSTDRNRKRGPQLQMTGLNRMLKGEALYGA